MKTFRRDYDWISREHNYPVLKVSGFVANGIFAPSFVTFVDTFRSSTVINNILKPQADFESETDIRIFDTLQITNLSRDPLPDSSYPSWYEWTITPDAFYYVNATDSTSENPAVVFTDSIPYTIKLRANNQFGADSLERIDYVNVSGFTGLMEGNTRPTLAVFPHPVRRNENLHITFPASRVIESIAIYNLQGQLVSSPEIKRRGENVMVPLNFPPGHYLISLRSEGQVWQAKITVID